MLSYDLLFSNTKCINIDLNKLSIIIYDFFDDVNYRESTKGKIDLVNFSSAIVNKDLLNDLSNYSTSKSYCILTWMQITAKEEVCMLLICLEEYYRS